MDCNVKPRPPTPTHRLYSSHSAGLYTIAFGLKGQRIFEVFQETPLASALQCGYGCAPLEIYWGSWLNSSSEQTHSVSVSCPQGTCPKGQTHTCF